LLLSQSALLNAQVILHPTHQPDTSFFGIPRYAAEDIDEYCKKDVQKQAECEEILNGPDKAVLALSPSYTHLYTECRDTYGAQGVNPRNICLQYYKYGVDRAQAWKAYDRAFWSEIGDYWELSPTELYEKYEEVSKDIALLWEINPEYKDMKRGERIVKFIIAWDITVIAWLVGTVVGPLLYNAGFKMAGNVASLLPIEAANGAAAASTGWSWSIRAIFKKVIAALAKGHFWADLGISIAYMAIDGLFVEGAFYMYRQLNSELETLQNHVDTEYAIVNRNLIEEILDPQLSEEQKKELEQYQDEIKTLNQQLKVAMREAMERDGWGDDPMVKREAVVTLYALEYIRAEMADISDYFRYREAAIDLLQMYFSGDLTRLPDERKELYKEIAEAHESKMLEQRKKLAELQKKLDGSVLNLSGGTPYFRAGHI